MSNDWPKTLWKNYDNKRNCSVTVQMSHERFDQDQTWLSKTEHDWARLNKMIKRSLLSTLRKSRATFNRMFSVFSWSLLWRNQIKTWLKSTFTCSITSHLVSRSTSTSISPASKALTILIGFARTGSAGVIIICNKMLEITESYKTLSLYQSILEILLIWETI